MAAKTNYEKNGNKYFRATATVGKDGDGKPIRKEFYGKSKKEAEAKRDDYMDGIKAGLNTDYAEMTVGQFMKVWLFDVMKIECADSTFDRYEGIYRNYIRETPLAHLKVHEINRLTLQRHYNAMYEAGKSTAKIKNLNKLLKTFFNYAIAEGYIVKNPCFKISIPKDNNMIDDEYGYDVDPFTEDEIKLIGQHIKPDIKIIFSLDLGTGLRVGELLALTEQDIDFVNSEVKINKAIKLVKVINRDGVHKYEHVIKPPKSKSSVRTIPIPRTLLKPLRKHITAQKEKYFRNGLLYNASSLLFTTDSCKYIDAKNLLRAWERTLKRAGVRYRKLHNIRHTYATKLFEAGVPLITISKLLGHHSIEITARIYVHVMPKEKNDAVQKLNYLFKN